MITKLNQTLLSILIIMTVIVIGMITINQTMGFIYKTELGKTPCKLCTEQNPTYERCIVELDRAPYSNNIRMENLTFVGSQ